MSWKIKKIIFKVESPIHIGYKRYSNLMTTRPYVPSRTLLGVLTHKLTYKVFSKPQWEYFRATGGILNTLFKSTYLYPAIWENNNPTVYLPWEHEDIFMHKFIGSYVSTALENTSRIASEGSLHEIEYLSPRTKDKGEQVYLVGYVFIKNDHNYQHDKLISQAIETQAIESLKNNYSSDEIERIEVHMGESLISQIKEKLSDLQNLLNGDITVGGEKTYGWGRISLKSLEEIKQNNFQLGSQNYRVDLSQDEPVIHLASGSKIPAHLIVTDRNPGSAIKGPVEPLVRREWKKGPGSKITYDGVAYLPGSRVQTENGLKASIKALGYLYISK